MRVITALLTLAGLALTLAPASVAAHTDAAPSGPVFITTTGQSISSGSGLAIVVRSMRRATGYLWSVSQDNRLAWQNLAYDGSLSGTHFYLNPLTAAYRRLHPGSFQVTVRAHLRPDVWTRASVASFTLRGRQAPPTATPVPPTATPVPPPTATPAPQIHAGDVLYTADVTRLFGGREWKHVDGMLVNDGTGRSTILLPYKSPVANYAVEAEIQSLPETGSSCSAFGIRSRMTGSSGGYGGIIGCSGAALQYGDNGTTFAAADYGLDTDFHTYRLEVRGNDVRLLVDGTPLVDAQDNHYLTGGQTGLYDNNGQINVRAIRVIAL